MFNLKWFTYEIDEQEGKNQNSFLISAMGTK